MGLWIYNYLFPSIPTILIVLLGISIYRYCSAKMKNKKVPDTFSPEEIKKRKITTIVLSMIVGVMLAVVIGFFALLFMAVANM